MLAKIGGLAVIFVLLPHVGRAAEEPLAAALAEYKQALPALEAKYGVVRMKGSWLQKYNSEQNPNSFKFKFEVSRNRGRFKALTLDTESESLLQGIRKSGSHVILFTPTERIILRKGPGDEVFAVQKEDKPDDTSLEDYLRQNHLSTPYFAFPVSGRGLLRLALLMDDARLTCVEAKDIVVDGKPRRRLHFKFTGPPPPPPAKGIRIGVTSAISLLVAPGEHHALYGYTQRVRRPESEYPLIFTDWMESDAADDGFPIPKAVKNLRIRTGPVGDKIKLPDGQEVIGKIEYEVTETIDSFDFKADPDEAFTLKAF